MQAAITGVVISIFQPTREIVPAADGYLGRLTEEPLLLQVGVARGYNTHGFAVDGKKNVVSKRDISEQPDDGKVYQVRIPVRRSERSDDCYTAYPLNNLRLAEQMSHNSSYRFDETGAVRLWEIAVISQHGKFFLTVQNTYLVECYQDARGLKSYPRFDNWPDMNDYLVGLLPVDIAPAPVDQYCLDDMPVDDVSFSDQGVVTWFNNAQGFGCLRLRNGSSARVHWSQVPPRPRRAYLEKGEVVLYRELCKPKTDKGRKTSFEQEVLGVTIVGH